MRTRILATAAAVGLLAIAAPANAAESTDCGFDLADAAFDNTTTLSPSPAAPTAFQPSTALDLRNLALRHDAKGTTTAVLDITNLSRKIPAGSTSVNWTVQWTAADGTITFVRAVNDLANNLVFEWGVQTPPVDLVVTSVLPRYEYRAATTGTFTEGPDGRIEITIPASLSAPGTVFKDIYAQSSEGRQVVPNALATPTRGLSNPSDRLPDGTDLAGPWTVAACPA